MEGIGTWEGALGLVEPETGAGRRTVYGLDQFDRTRVSAARDVVRNARRREMQ